jgi:hypothetical protein
MLPGEGSWKGGCTYSSTKSGDKSTKKPNQMKGSRIFLPRDNLYDVFVIRLWPPNL